MSGQKKRVLSVGQCGMDHGSISRLLERSFGAEVVGADTKAEALEEARRGECALVLVNRLLDRDGSAGMDIVRAFKADELLKSVPIMLVSNYEEAQHEAIAHGALPGFGKASLEQPQTVARLGQILKAEKIQDR